MEYNNGAGNVANGRSDIPCSLIIININACQAVVDAST
jgi:hypothetical protein